MQTTRHFRWRVATAATVAMLLAAVGRLAADPPARATAGRSRIELRRDDQAGRLDARIDGSTAFTFHYGPNVDLPHLVFRSPSGKPMTVVRTEPYPHHRSFWFADTVQLAGKRKVSFYNAYYTRTDKKDPNSPFRDRIRLVKLGPPSSSEHPQRAAIVARLLWEMDLKTPVLDEERHLVVLALGGGEYLLDVRFVLRASYGDVAFVSDAVHYAWPYVRMTRAYSVQGGGGRITSSAGGVNQKGTHNHLARWVDYSAAVGGVTEGLAVFSHPSNGHPHRWLTRDYGTFGPRRPDARSGKRFTLKKGQTLEQRVGVFVHRGDVKAGKVAQRYASYVARTTQGKAKP